MIIGYNYMLYSVGILLYILIKMSHNLKSTKSTSERKRKREAVGAEDQEIGLNLCQKVDHRLLWRTHTIVWPRLLFANQAGTIKVTLVDKLTTFSGCR